MKFFPFSGKAEKVEHEKWNVKFRKIQNTSSMTFSMTFFTIIPLLSNFNPIIA